MKIEKTYEPSSQDIAAVREILLAYNLQHFETTEKKPLALYLKEADRIVGGLTGAFFGDWLEIDYLVVEQRLRGQGLGQQLLEMAETEARDHGCKYIFLYTFGFQGKDFYPKFGFQEIMKRENYPLTGSEHWFLKTLI